MPIGRAVGMFAGMTNIDAILQRIRSGIATHGRKKDVSLDTGISMKTLVQAKDPDWNPTANTIRAIDQSLAKLSPASPATPHQPE